MKIIPVILILIFVGISGCTNTNNNTISPSTGFPVSEAPNLAVEISKTNGNIEIIQFKGVTLDKNQCLYILSKSIVMIDSGQTGNIPIKHFGDAVEPSGYLNTAILTRAQYVDMAYRTYKWMDKNGRSPNHTGIDYAGSPDLSTDMTIKAFVQVLTEYKTTGKLPDSITV